MICAVLLWPVRLVRRVVAWLDAAEEDALRAWDLANRSNEDIDRLLARPKRRRG